MSRNQMGGAARILIWPAGATIAGLLAAAFYGGGHAVAVVAMLIGVEVAVSFDNAVVNAGVLRTLSPGWQRAFMTIGIAIAVFGMRVLFPIAIVVLATGQAFGTVVDQALHEPEAYARHVEGASPMIGAFGGMFLLLLAASFFFSPDRERRWLRPIERPLGAAGRFPRAPLVVAVGALLLIAHLVSDDHQRDVLVAGLAGIATFLLMRGLRDLMSSDATGRGGATASAGFGGFLYLETLDASFSLDGVLGAFAISSDIVLVALGLGVGAMFIRATTIYLVEHRMLRQFPYLTHGAHWAIAALAVFLLVGIEQHPPEWLTGSVGLGVILASVLSSR